MPAKSAEEICGLFKQYMAEGDIDGLLNLYDPEAVILDKSGEVKRGEEGLRENLTLLQLRRRVSTSLSSRSSRLTTLR